MFYRNYQWLKCTLTGQRNTKHGLLCIFKSHVKIFTLDDYNTAIYHRRFSKIFKCVNCVLHSISVNMKPRHTTKTALNTASSIHQLLKFVNAMNRDVAVSCFRVSAPGADAISKTAQEGYWFSSHAGFLELCGAKALNSSVMLWSYSTPLLK